MIVIGLTPNHTRLDLSPALPLEGMETVSELFYA
jgi:hypothetical protein